MGTGMRYNAWHTSVVQLAVLQLEYSLLLAVVLIWPVFAQIYYKD